MTGEGKRPREGGVAPRGGDSQVVTGSEGITAEVQGTRQVMGPGAVDIEIAGKGLGAGAIGGEVTRESEGTVTGPGISCLDEGQGNNITDGSGTDIDAVDGFIGGKIGLGTGINGVGSCAPKIG